MADQEQFSDDISALWGPDDTGFLGAAPVARPEPPVHEEPNGRHGGDGPLRAVQAELQRLADLIEINRMAMVRPADLEALRTQLQLDVGQELAQLQAVARTHVDERLEKAEARAQLHAEQRTGVLADRLSALEQEARRGIAQVAAAIDAHEMEPVGKHRARKLRDELQAEFVDRLASVRAEAKEAAAQRAVEVAAQVERRVEEALAAQRAQIDALRAEHEAGAARLAEAVPRPEVDALTARFESGLAHVADAERAGRSELRADFEAVAAGLESRLTHQAESDRAARAELRSLLAQASIAGAASVTQLTELGATVAHLEAELADLADATREARGNLAAERESVAGQLAELSGRVDEAHATAINSDLEQRLVQLGGLVDLHHAQAALATDLDRLRAQLEDAIIAQVAEVRAELRAELRAAEAATAHGMEAAQRWSLWSRHRPQSEG